MLAEDESNESSMRAFCLYTARGKSLDEGGAREQRVLEELSLLTPVCAFCSEEGFQIAPDAIQIHGGYGS